MEVIVIVVSTASNELLLSYIKSVGFAFLKIGEKWDVCVGIIFKTIVFFCFIKCIVDLTISFAVEVGWLKFFCNIWVFR